MCACMDVCSACMCCLVGIGRKMKTSSKARLRLGGHRGSSRPVAVMYKDKEFCCHRNSELS